MKSKDKFWYQRYKHYRDMLNHLINIFIAPKIGQMIGHIGERKTLTIEYVGLIFVFIGYALVESASFAAALYVIDHLFFAMAIALKTHNSDF